MVRLMIDYGLTCSTPSTGKSEVAAFAELQGRIAALFGEKLNVNVASGVPSAMIRVTAATGAEVAEALAPPASTIRPAASNVIAVATKR